MEKKDKHKNQTKQTQQSNKKAIAIILALLLITAVVFSMYAYSKYKTTLTRSGTATVAKWSFKVIDGDTTTANILDFPITRTDTNTQVKEGKIAPRNVRKI